MKSRALGQAGKAEKTGGLTHLDHSWLQKTYIMSGCTVGSEIRRKYMSAVWKMPRDSGLKTSGEQFSVLAPLSLRQHKGDAAFTTSMQWK